VIRPSCCPPTFAYLRAGPNTVTGHTSAIFTSECQVSPSLTVTSDVTHERISQVNYSLQLAAPILDGRIKSIDVKRKVFDEYNEKIQSRLQGSVMTQCTSWYRVGKVGKITNMFPGLVNSCLLSGLPRALTWIRFQIWHSVLVVAPSSQFRSLPRLWIERFPHSQLPSSFLKENRYEVTFNRFARVSVGKFTPRKGVSVESEISLFHLNLPDNGFNSVKSTSAPEQ
jgi:hypothetical protein